MDPVTTGALKRLGGRYLPSWIVSTEEASMKAPVLRFFKDINEAIDFFHARFSWDYVIQENRKRLYWDTVDLVIPPPLYRPPQGNSEGSRVLNKLRKYPVKTSNKDFFVKFHVEALPVKTWLESKGFFVAWSTNCALCPFPETLQHVFLFCTKAEIIWSELRNAFSISAQLNWETLKYLQVEAGENKKCTEVLKLRRLHAIWRFRMYHTLVLEKGKPAWHHFVDVFAYTSSLLEPTEMPGFESWPAMEVALRNYMMKRGTFKH
ncbi:unnamed protein product [Ixodes persulcatus]